jgi:uncharacterized protein YbbC (DUF1343 family)
MRKRKIIPLTMILLVFSLYFPTSVQSQVTIKCGADRTDQYLSILNDKRIAVVANHTSFIGSTHLVDSLIKLEIDVVKIFGPEHGYTGSAGPGTFLEDETDHETGVEVISLYGSHRRPTQDDLEGIDLVVFDIQDVGVRHYTYLSTMTYMMEACAEDSIPFVVLDRPNPNGFYVDGPLNDPQYSSFIGLHEVPVVYGMTIGEYAQMVNGEGWMKNGIKCDLNVIPCENWDHRKFYDLPVKPSPNLPNMISIYLYPSLVFFERTIMTVGWGTDFPFQVYGHPEYPESGFSFTPENRPEAGSNLKYSEMSCNGIDLRELDLDFFRNNRAIVLYWLVDAYQQLGATEDFFIDYFDDRAGTTILREQIIEGYDVLTIAASWKEELEAFKEIRKKYLLYQDFE